MYRNHAEHTLFEIGSEDLENDTFFYRFLRFPPSIDARDLFGDMRCPRGEECFPHWFNQGCQFSEIDDSWFQTFFQNTHIPVPVCGSMYLNHVDQTFFEIGSENLENDTLFYHLPIFRSTIYPRDLLNDMRCSIDGKCFQYKFEQVTRFFKNWRFAISFDFSHSWN